MRALLFALAFTSASVSAQPGVLSSDTEPFKHDITVGMSGAYYGGFGIDTEVRLRRHVATRVGLGLTSIDSFRRTVDPGARVTVMGVVGDPRLEFQAGIGGTASWTTVYGNGPIGRELAYVPHVYAGVRTVLAFGDTPDGRPAPAPHLSVRLGGMVTVNEPRIDGPTVRPEVGVGFAF